MCCAMKSGTAMGGRGITRSEGGRACLSAIGTYIGHTHKMISDHMDIIRDITFPWIDDWLCRNKEISVRELCVAIGFSPSTGSLFLGMYAGSQYGKIVMGSNYVGITPNFTPQYSPQERNRARKLVKYEPSLSDL
jgi:hypothetical protein